jgi:hypothetical protein
MKLKVFAVLSAACALSLPGAGVSAAAPLEVEVAQYEYTRHRDDRDAGPAQSAAQACTAGHATLAIRDASAACAVAHDYAVAARNFDDALRFAVTGCEKRRNATDCRRASRLPLLMGNESLSVPQRYAVEVKRLAEFVCFSGARIEQAYAGDATARECANLARHFVLAKDPEYARALLPAARTYFEAVFDAAVAGRFYKAACSRWQHRESCAYANSVIVGQSPAAAPGAAGRGL